jgi:hypothetical protein
MLVVLWRNISMQHSGYIAAPSTAHDCSSLLAETHYVVDDSCTAAAAAVGSFLSKLPAAAPQLCVLDLSDCRGLPGAAIAGLLQQLRGLSRVKLDGIPEVRLYA